MKKYLFILVCISTLLFGVISASAYDKYNGIPYSISDGEVLIIGGNYNLSGDLVIPETIDGYPVTAIRESAFSNHTKITSISIPDSVTTIGRSSFYGCSSLKSITLPKNLKVVEGNLLRNCSALETVTLGDNVETIKNASIYGCGNLTDINIPKSVKTMESYAIYNCNNLKNVYIEDLSSFITISRESDTSFLLNSQTCLYIGNQLLTELVIPEDVTDIGRYAFYGYSYLTSVTIHDHLSSTGFNAFSKCTNLENVVIEDGVETIGAGCFKGCAKLSSITIPDSVTVISGSAFSGCSNLSNITLSKNLESIMGSAFLKCSSLKSITIPDSVTTIGDWAFSECSSLKSLTVPENVTSIGKATFSNCTALEEICWNAINVADIAYESGDYNTDYPFSYAGTKSTGINVIFGDKVEYIPAYLFKRASYPDPNDPTYTNFIYKDVNIKNITFSNSIKSIGSGAFADCVSIEKLHIKDIDSFVSIAFNYEGANPLSNGTSGLYLNNELLTNITLSSNAKIIGDFAFYGYNKLKSINIPESVTSIGKRAFWLCEGLTIIAIPDSVTSIGSYAFNACHNLNAITIGTGVTNIGNYAFRGCDALEQINWNAINVADFETYNDLFYYCGTAGDGITVVFGDKVEKIPANVFNSYENNTPIPIISVTIPDSVKVIGDKAFRSCYTLKTATIGDGLEYVGDYAFGSCTHLDNITIKNNGKSITYIGEYAFCDTGINNFIFNDNITRIGKYAFRKTQITSVVLPDSITSIEQGVFSSCNNLTTVTLGSKVESIGYYGFNSCYLLESITLPGTLTSIGDYAFQNCNTLTSVTFDGSKEQWSLISIGADNTKLTSANITFKPSAEISNINAALKTDGSDTLEVSFTVTNAPISYKLLCASYDSNGVLLELKEFSLTNGEAKDTISSVKVKEIKVFLLKDFISLTPYCYSKSKIL